VAAGSGGGWGGAQRSYTFFAPICHYLPTPGSSFSKNNAYLSEKL